MTRNNAHLSKLIDHLVGFSAETEWVEFKLNNDDPQEIGEYISALANSAALCGQAQAFIIWGIVDATRAVAGTTFRPRQQKVGNEALENWLVRLLSPRLHFLIREFEYDGHPLVLFEIPQADHVPVRFGGTEYIRVGTHKKRLREHPEKERALWSIFSETVFEKGIAAHGVSSDVVLTFLDYPSYFGLTGQRLPDNRKGILSRLAKERFIFPKGDDVFDISNLGAILFASDLNEFETLSRKALRVIFYNGKNRTRAIGEHTDTKGYAVGFHGTVSYINDRLPKDEKIGQAFREEGRMYPEIAIRELVANAIIHQDFRLTGTGPMVEVFSDRIEITNPGVPLIDTLRFIDEPPQSRNELLASFMRRINICEERGSGIDKVILSVERHQLPAPDFRVTPRHTIAILFGPCELAKMEKIDRIRACYQHACILYVSNSFLTNATLRERFSIDDKNYPMASRVISDTVREGLIRPHDPANKSKKLTKYVPFWA